MPREWSQLESPTLLGVLRRHACDEAWVPDVITGRAATDGDPADADLLGDDPVACCDALTDTVTAAVKAGDIAETFRFTYGDCPVDEGSAHLATYRPFQVCSIAKRFGIPFPLFFGLVAVLNSHVTRTPTNGGSRRAPAGHRASTDANDETFRLRALGF